MFGSPRLNQNQETDAPDAAQRAMRRVAALALVALVQLVQPTAASFDPLASFRPAKLPRRGDSTASLDSPPRDPPPPPPPPLSPQPPPPEPPATVRVQAESPPTFYFQPPEGALENRGGRDRAFDDQYQPPYDSYDDDYEGDAAHSTLQTAPPHVAVATNSFLRADRVYDKYAGVANPMETMYVRQGKVGARLQDATWLLAEPFADKPTAIDDYLRCSTLLRSCTPGEVLRRCTYEPRGAWYRERRSRTNAPLDWPYCEPDLVNVYF